jgi:4-amino-4-deoxy-L-arabinose transferase-like glycosyltransferase
MNVDVPTIAASALYFVKHYSALVILAIVAAAIGARIVGRRIQFASQLESLSFSTALGLGAISFLILLIGQLHVLFAPVLLLSLFVAVLICSPVLFEWARRAREYLRADKTRLARIALGTAIVFAVVLPFLVYPLYPARSWDATQYHLAVAKIYVREHAVVFTPYLRYPVFPQTNQMLFTGALLVFDEQFAQQTQLLMLIVLYIAMIAFGVRHLTARSGWWGAGLFLASPLVFHLASIAYADIGLTLFCFLSCFAFWNWFQTKSNAWLVLCGIFGGLAFGSKYTGAAFPLIFFATLLVTEWRKRNYFSPLLVAVTSLLVASPWLLRNIYYTGNPLFPFLENFFTGIFGQRQIEPAWFEQQIGASVYIGIGRSVASLLSLPWKMAVDNSVFIPEAPVTKLIASLLPVTILCAAFYSRVRWLLVLAVAYTLFWFFGYQIIRYLLPAFPLYCLATGAAADWLFPGKLRTGSSGHRVVTALVSALLVFPSWYYVAQHVRWEGMLPTTEAQRDRYLSDLIPSYPAYKYLNGYAGSAYRLYALDETRMAYFADGTFMGDAYGEANYDRILGKMSSGESLYDELKLLRATHFLFNAQVVKAGLPRDEFFERNFRLAFAEGRVELFELSPEKRFEGR